MLRLVKRSFHSFLSNEHTQLQAATRQFALKSIGPIAASIDANNAFPNHLWKELGEMGLLGITAPEAYGGQAMGYLAHVIVMEELSRLNCNEYFICL